jgi:Reverse transcriptase (RNA-dependent DNA polymerase)
LLHPFSFIEKKDGSLQPVQDYRQLNAMTILDQYPIPRIINTVQKLTHSYWFTKLDVQWGYNNICIKQGDEWKAAFITEFGLYEPLIMFFGLCNSTATFQRMMNDIFKDLMESRKVIVYLDDILIHTAGLLKDHVSMVRRVLQVLRMH